ncbi:hypothetical protein OS122_26475 [Mycolicibacterium mucogenicum]|nr:hypothetical protein [Mycolicibacterium mucogenicum]MCX8564435.1 hypothetical protein [Mycolicibacterium mucogenicum]
MKPLKFLLLAKSEPADPSDDVVVDAPELEAEQSEELVSGPKAKRRFGLSRQVLGGRVLPVLALLLALAAGFLRWDADSIRSGRTGGADAMRAASEGAVALLSYRADTAQKDLDAAKDRLTGTFLDAYTKLTNDVVIPGAKQKQVSAVATVPAAAVSSSTASHAVVMLFIDQTVTIGKDAPTDSASSVRVTLDKVGDRWLISQFDPV